MLFGIFTHEPVKRFGGHRQEGSPVALGGTLWGYTVSLWLRRLVFSTSMSWRGWETNQLGQQPRPRRRLQRVAPSPADGSLKRQRLPPQTGSRVGSGPSLRGPPCSQPTLICRPVALRGISSCEPLDILRLDGCRGQRSPQSAADGSI